MSTEKERLTRLWATPAADSGADSGRLLELQASLGWKFAKTYAKGAPHEYVIRGKSCPPEAFDVMAALIDKNAVPEKFYRYTVYYWRPDGSRDKYWHMGEVINRDHLDGWSDEEKAYRLEHLVVPGDFIFTQDGQR